ncbi:hypothetical protein LOC54_03970 [Acetobacter sp. AN02]|uniref:hypothetical protein n=1 Tax=Acetobacter sp. AN02 TaxID=2894186 RepID=UPI0024343D7B|nr:hypothetical protein [Acetobacter sp. AN02]MDG6094273.1 hypothetical protein [Acetobacter sp. AN02]
MNGDHQNVTGDSPETPGQDPAAPLPVELPPSDPVSPEAEAHEPDIPEEEEEVRLLSFEDAVIEAFVPPDIRRMDEYFMRLTEMLLSDEDFMTNIESCRSRFTEEITPGNMDAFVVAGLVNKMDDIREIRQTINLMVMNTLPYDDFFGRRLTPGTEQCPWWENYERAPSEARKDLS